MAFSVQSDAEWWWADTIGAADPPKIFRPAENLTTTKSVGVWGRSPRKKEVQSKISVLVLFANIRRFSMAKNLLSRFVVLPASRLMMPW